ncbi:hypothetical protein R3P38DRAFT_2761461 [Favolaschia claudopus]|uniref:Uncharacterized protein n=1 Tax=Favolaschia claudopus TaxID=2862362 RepID=A0AAW0DQQ8_9AGAR
MGMGLAQQIVTMAHDWRLPCGLIARELGSYREFAPGHSASTERGKSTSAIAIRTLALELARCEAACMLGLEVKGRWWRSRTEGGDEDGRGVADVHDRSTLRVIEMAMRAAHVGFESIGVESEIQAQDAAAGILDVDLSQRERRE